ncbi:MAG TPA: copper chaperone PCu(A)C [Gammaproteobacteria bacterium]|nr:copper chaperone PCu(A)C [Gammaproteobacteria bacterium]
MKQLLLAILLCWNTLALAEVDVQVDHAWVREAPPGARMMAAYMTLINRGEEDITLVDVNSPAFRMVMLHKSAMVDGMARMSHVDKLDIPAGASVALEPGSYHLMMPAPDTRLVSGDKVEFILEFADESQLRVEAEVRKAP